MSNPEPIQENKQEVPQEQKTEAQAAVPAVGFLVMAFTDEQAGDQALEAMKQGKKAKTFYFEEAGVMRQDATGKVHYHETGDMRSGKGAGIGALVGGILGVLGGPGGVALGAGAGAALGAAFSHGDAGFRDESLNTVGLALKPGTSAVVAITSTAFLKAVQQQVPVEATREVVKNLAQEISNNLSEGKSVALGVVLSEQGLAAQKVAVSEKSTEVVALVVTEDAALTASAVVTEEGAAYQVAGATKDVAFMEAGVVTKEGEVAAVTVIVPEEKELPAKAEDTEAKADPA